ncbi:MAG: PAS domain S-box protein [Chitinophagia bacterium]|nr:PAS domain S-box protein [Chitinophagia bacterium]
MTNVTNDIALRLQAVIDTAIDGIITINRNGFIESINKSALRLFGYQEDDLIGQNVSILMPEPYRKEHDSYLMKYHETRKPKIIGIGREVEGKTKEGRIIPLRLAVSEVILNNRIIFTGIVHDLSQIKETQNELRRANEALEEKVEERTIELEKLVNDLLQTNRKLERSELELTEALRKEIELNELKSRFVSMASHEFRTPLSTIMSSVALISKYTESEQDDKRQKHVTRIKSAVVNLTGILNDFLSLSKIEEGKIEIKKSNVDILALCKEVHEEVKEILKEGQELYIEKNGDSAIFFTDARILKNILFNLVSNAIKYSDDRIDCFINMQNRNLVIEVKDRGIGIPTSEHHHLFDRFFRASNVEMIQGTGLGLNIVKRYVNLLHGDIDFESVENLGTTFKLSFQNSQ